MRHFTPGLSPAADAEAAVWLYFQGDSVWVDEAGPLHPPPETLGLSPARRTYVGEFDHRPCFVGELESTPAKGGLISLRAAWMTLDEDVFGPLSAAAELLHFERSHRACGRCGGPLVAQVVDRARRCESCRADYYPRIAPAVIVLVHDGPRILLTHAGNRPFWALVAGYLEPGETLEGCAAREVHEETGVAIDELRYFGSQAWPFPSQVMVGFRSRYAGGGIVVDKKELDEARWFEIDALPPVPPPRSIARRMIEARIAELRP